uniref:Uncharacterized protein n=1 Tax=Anguilla anguilla TaxID=7936 RepID=A0A0E9RSI4_ANGAN
MDSPKSFRLNSSNQHNSTESKFLLPVL